MKSSQFNVLPPEMMVEFLLKLNLEDLTNFCKTSQAAAIYCQDDQFWKDKYKHDFHLSPSFHGSRSQNLPSDSNLSWKEQYKLAYSVPKSPISVGNRHYAIIDNQNMLYIGGDPSFDGIPHYHYENDYDEILSKISPFKQKIRSVSCGNKYTGAVTKDGKIYFWGEDLYYIFGGDKNAVISVPREFKIEGKAIKIACDNNSSFHGPPMFALILEDRSVFLRIYHFFSRTGVEWIKISARLDIKALDISVSSYGLAIVSTESKLYYLGRGFGTRHGEKIGITYKSGKIVVNPVHIPIPETIKQVSMGSGHIGVLSTKGNVYLWGSNYWGQLGKGWKYGNEYIESKEYMIDNPQKLSFPAPLRSNGVLSNSKNFKELPISFITCQGETTAVIDKNGKLYIWGKSSNFGESNECIDIEEGLMNCPIQIGLKLQGSETATKKKFNYAAIGANISISTTSDGWVNIWKNDN